MGNDQCGNGLGEIRDALNEAKREFGERKKELESALQDAGKCSFYVCEIKQSLRIARIILRIMSSGASLGVQTIHKIVSCILGPADNLLKAFKATSEIIRKITEVALSHIKDHKH